MKLESAKAISDGYDVGLESGISLGVNTAFEIRDVILKQIRRLLIEGDPDMAIALIDDILK